MESASSVAETRRDQTEPAVEQASPQQSSTGAIAGPDTVYRQPADCSTAKREPSDNIVELLAADNNAFVPSGASEKLYFYCFAIEVLDYCTVLMMTDDNECMGCFLSSIEECTHSCSIGGRTFMGFVRDHFCEAVAGVDSLAVRTQFGEFVTKFPEIPNMTTEQFNVCEFRCRSSWRAAIYNYLDVYYKRYPVSWVDTFTPALLSEIPSTDGIFINLGTGIP